MGKCFHFLFILLRIDTPSIFAGPPRPSLWLVPASQNIPASLGRTGACRGQKEQWLSLRSKYANMTPGSAIMAPSFSY